MDLSFYMPTRIICCENAVSLCADNFLALGKKCLIVTGSSSARLSGALDDVIITFSKNGISYDIYNKIEQNPTVASCREAGIIAHDIGADFILGIGGGSALDAAKAAAVFAANPKIDSNGLYALNWANKPLPIALIGTTAGTGSEATAVSVLTTDEGLKKSIRDDSIYPTLSLSDPKYTMTLSTKFTKSTAVDALSHCIESYFNKTANDISRAAATNGARIIVSVFKEMLQGEMPGIAQRKALYNASILGGIAISVTGTAFPHAMGYFLSEEHGVPHGMACAVYLPAFLNHCYDADPIYANKFFDLIGCKKSELISIIKKIAPNEGISVSPFERVKLMPRWENNKGLEKTIGDFSAKMANQLLRDLFEQ